MADFVITIHDSQVRVACLAWGGHDVATVAEVARLLASTDQGREAMARSLGSTLDAPLMATLLRGLGWVCFPSQDVVAALRASGWACCPPGAEDLFAIVDNCRGGILTKGGHPAIFLTAEAALDDLESDESIVRYVRCDAPGTAEGGCPRCGKMMCWEHGKKEPSATGQGGKG